MIIKGTCVLVLVLAGLSLTLLPWTALIASANPAATQGGAAPIPKAARDVLSERELVIYIEPLHSDLQGYCAFVEKILPTLVDPRYHAVTVALWPTHVDDRLHIWTGKALDNAAPKISGFLENASASIGPAEFEAGLVKCVALGGKNCDIVIVSGDWAIHDFPAQQQKMVQGVSKDHVVHMIWYGPASLRLSSLVSGYAVTVESGQVAQETGKP